jgi:hypothetical protein
MRNPRLLALAEAAGDDELVRDVTAAYVVAATRRGRRSLKDEALVAAAGVDPRTVWRWPWLSHGKAMLRVMDEERASLFGEEASPLEVRRRRLVRLWSSGDPEPHDPLPPAAATAFDARAIVAQGRRSELVAS